MADDLITLAEAKRRLRWPEGSAEDADLKALIAEASALVRRFVAQRRTDDGSPSWADQVEAWDAQTVPRDVKSAVFTMLAFIERWRGNDAAREMPPLEAGRLPAQVEWILVSYRDPAVS